MTPSKSGLGPSMKNYVLHDRGNVKLLIMLLIILIFTIKFHLIKYTIIIVVIIAIIVWFHRGPTRLQNIDARTLICPCQGKVIKNSPGHIAIFLSLTDIHIQYAPLYGRISRKKYYPGTFYPAGLVEKSKYNERLVTTITSPIGDVKIVQIAGVLARSIVSFKSVGDFVEVGEPIGMIKFGSRVDIFYPESRCESLVRINDKVYLGQKLCKILF